MNDFLRAVFLMIAGTLGAGIFSLPYAFSRSGFLPSIFGSFFIALTMITVNVLYGKIILKTKGDHQLPGYSEKYLGKLGKITASLAMFFSLNFALAAYTILGGELFALFLGQMTTVFHKILFYFLRVFLFYQGFKKILKIESFLVTILLGLMIVLPLALLPFFQKGNFVLFTKIPFAFWGTTIFALTGFSAIPEVEESLRKRKRLFLPAVIFGTTLAFFVTLIFSLSIVEVSGAATTADALSGLLQFSPLLVRLAAGIGVLIMVAAFLNLANVLKEMFFRDFKIKENLAKFLAVAPAAAAVFLPQNAFPKIISASGSLFLSLSAILICLISRKVNPKYKTLSLIIILFFVIGAIMEILTKI